MILGAGAKNPKTNMEGINGQMEGKLNDISN